MDAFDRKRFRRPIGRQYNKEERKFRRESKKANSLPAFEDPAYKEYFEFLKEHKIKRTKSNRKVVLPLTYLPRHSRHNSEVFKSVAALPDLSRSEFNKSYFIESNSQMNNQRKSVGLAFSDMENSSMGNLSRNGRAISKTQNLSRFFDQRNRERLRKTSADKKSQKNGLKVKKSNSKQRNKYNNENKVLTGKTKKLGKVKPRNSPMPRNRTNSLLSKKKNSSLPKKTKMMKKKPVLRKPISYLDNKKSKKLQSSPKKKKKTIKQNKTEQSRFKDLESSPKRKKKPKKKMAENKKKLKTSIERQNTLDKLKVRKTKPQHLNIVMTDSFSLLSNDKTDKDSPDVKDSNILLANGISIPLKEKQNTKSFTRKTNALRKSSRNLAGVKAEIKHGVIDTSKSLGNLQIHKRIENEWYLKRKENKQMNGKVIDEKIELINEKTGTFKKNYGTSSFNKVIQFSRNEKTRLYEKEKFWILLNLKKKNLIDIEDDIYFNNSRRSDGLLLSPKAGLLNQVSSKIGFSKKIVKKMERVDSVRQRRIKKKIILASSHKLGVCNLTEYEPVSYNNKRLLDTSNREINETNFLMESYNNYIGD